MATKIEWTDETWNPIRARNKATGGVGHFCIHASEGCRFCYSEGFQPRFNNPIRFANQDRAKVDIFLDGKKLLEPLHWKKPRMIFPCSMTDLFGEWVPDDWIDRIFAVMALCPQHIFQVLTKRTKRMRAYGAQDRRSRMLNSMIDVVIAEMTSRAMKDIRQVNKYRDTEGANVATWPLPNVWLGTSVEDQPTADERIPDLLATPAAIRFVSYEPALGPIDFENIRIEDHRLSRGHGFIDVLRCDHIDGFEDNLFGGARLDQIIMGGESGSKARPMHPDWARSARDQCAAAGVAFFFKQWGEFAPARTSAPPQPSDINRLGDHLVRVGKKIAGRLLDGIEHNAMPLSSFRSPLAGEQARSASEGPPPPPLVQAPR